MAFNNDLTLLFGLEAQENIVETFEKVNSAIEHTSGLFEDMGKTAADAGDLMTTAMEDPETTGALLQARMTQLTEATTALAAAQEDLRTATAQVAAVGDGNAAALDLQAAAADRYMAALRTASAAQVAQAGAAETDIAAKTAATGATNDLADATASGGLISKKAAGIAAATAAAVLGIGYESAKAASQYNQSMLTVQNSANLTNKQTQDIGQAFIVMSENSTASASTIATSFGQVAGQLSTLSGHALTTQQSVKFMDVAIKAAAASGEPLSAVTSNLAKLMQQLHISVGGAANAESILYNVGTLTAQNSTLVGRQIENLNGRLGVLAPTLQQTGSLMLDFTEHGVMARQSATVLSTALNTLTKTSHLTVPTMGEMSSALQKLPANVQAYGKALLDGKETVKQFEDQVKQFSSGTLASSVVGKYLKSFESLASQAKSSVGTINALKLTPVQEELAHLGITVFKTNGTYAGTVGILEQLGPKLAEIHNKQQQLAIATMLLGSQAKELLPSILAGKDGYEKAAKAIANHTAMEKAAQRAEGTFQAQMEKFHNTLTAVRIELGEAFLPIMEKVMGVFEAILKPVVSFMKNNKDLVAIIISVVGGLATLVAVLYTVHKVTTIVHDGFKDLQMVTGKVKDAVGDLIGKMKAKMTADDEVIGSNADLEGSQATLATSTGGLGVAMDESAASTEGLGVAAETAAPEIDAAGAPILAIAAAAALVVVGIYELVKHWKTVWGVIKEVGEDVWRGLKDAWNAFWGFLKDAWNKMESIGKDIFKALAVALLVMLGPIGIVIAGFVFFHKQFMKIWNDILSFLKTAVSDIKNGVDKIADFFENLGKTVLHDLTSGFVAVWNFFKDLPGKVVGFVDGLLVDMLHFGEDIVKNIVKGITNIGADVGGAITGLIKHIPLVGGLLSKGTGLIGDVFHVFHDGGLVPGPPGMHVPAILQAGETVVTANQMKSLGQMPQVIYAGGNRQGGGDVHLHVNMQGAVYGSLNEFTNALGKHLTSTLLPQAGVILTH